MATADQTSSGSTTTTRQIGGALVHFDNGAKVSEVDLTHTSSNLLSILDSPPAWAMAGFRTTNCKTVHLAWSIDREDVPAYIMSLLSNIGPVEHVGPTHRNNAFEVRLEQVMVFIDDGVAEVAAKECNRRHEFLDNTTLSVEVWSRIEFWIPIRAYKAIKAQLAELFGSWVRDTSSELSLLEVSIKSCNDNFACVALSGASKKAFTNAAALLKVEVEGKTLQGAKGPLSIWNGPVSSSIQHQIRRVGKRHQVHVLVDESKKTLKYFGPQDMFQAVQQELDGIIRASCRPTGDEPDKRNADAVDDDLECSICGGTAEQPATLQCGHTYCLECLENLCMLLPSMSSSEGYVACQHSVPVVCAKVPALDKLQLLLPRATFEAVLEASFTAHVRRNVGSYGLCPSPDCTHIHTKIQQEDPQGENGDNDRVPAVACEGCLEVVCLKCGQQHAGVTCAVFKHDKSDEQGPLDDFKRGAGIKDCGNCGTSIEKTYGCNHMTCGGCGSHICWVCVMTFTSAIDCVDHLDTMHADHENDNDLWNNDEASEDGNEDEDDLSEDEFTGGEDEPLEDDMALAAWRQAGGWVPADWTPEVRRGLW